VRWLSDAAVEHLRGVAEEPDLSGTRYELLGLLGRGGMGSVYRARDRELGREVALKVSAGPAPSPAELERLHREARVLARLEHPGVVPVHDLGTLPDGRLYYVMKLVRGRRLDEHVRDAGLPARLRIFERICEAVAFAHAQGVLHRDLKPENVMVGAFGEVLVLDWGVAKLVGVSEGEAAPAPPAGAGGTAAGTVLGTPGYMSPEQARGDVDHVDERSDVYALGAILRWLATDAGGRRGEALAAIWTRAGAEAPEARYGTVPELAADVARYLAGERVKAHPEGPLEGLRRLAVKHRTPLALVAAYLAMRVLLAFFTRS
jgi:eukaryotic-like serine/threonine-protein kinase